MNPLSASAKTREPVTLTKPTLQEIERELHRRVLLRVLWRGLAMLTVIVAVAALVSALWLPTLRVRGANMEPNLWAGDLVVARKGARGVKAGDIVAFYHNNSILLRRVIALPDDTVEMDGTGQVRVNGEVLDEPYVTMITMGACDVEFPQDVPAQSYFVLGDNRAEAVDSRSAAVGMIPQENVIGKVLIRLWPLFHGSSGAFVV